MKKYVVIGVNETPKYLYYLPLVKWAWAQFGWETFVFFIGQPNKVSDLSRSFIDHFWVISEYYYGYKSETIAQFSRMYAGRFIKADLLMTSDADIIPLSDYWKPELNKITCYGRDLSNEHQPMCFVSMSSKQWIDVMDDNHTMPLVKMFNDVDEANSELKNKWVGDQHILTKRLGNVQKTEINRGIDPKTNYPIGRVDRSRWTLDHKQLIDCHMPHDILTNDKSFHKVMELLHLNWPTQDFKWFVEYHRNFKKLL
jgi:hypothetical protein